jgi:hypothetical protein
MDVRPRGIWGSSSETQAAMSTSSMACIMRLWRLRGLYTTFEFEGMPGHVIVERVTFEEEEQDGKTKLTSESFFQTVEDRDIMLNLRVIPCSLSLAILGRSSSAADITAHRICGGIR